MHGAGQRIQPGPLLEPQDREAVGQHSGHRARQHRIGCQVAGQHQHGQERCGQHQAGQQDHSMALPGQQRAFDAALARVAQVGLVVEDVIDPVHHQIVGEQEEEAAHDEHRIEPASGQEIGGGEGIGGIHPRHRPGGGQNGANHGCGVLPVGLAERWPAARRRSSGSVSHQSPGTRSTAQAA